MKKSERRSHLWIPDQDITELYREPMGRSKEHNVSHEAHGEALAQGLRNVRLFLDGLHQDGTFADDLLTFRVILQDGEDFASRRRFIQDEGMNINAVKDRMHAVVTAHQESFDSLFNRVLRYRDKGIKRDFGAVAGFEPFTAEDKQAPALLRYFMEHPDEHNVDVSIMLMPNLTPEQWNEYTERVISRIRMHDGRLAGSPFALTDGTPMMRAFIPSAAASEIFSDPAIYRAEQTSFFRLTEPDSTPAIPANLQLNPKVNLDELPAVVVLDDGVTFPAGLQSLVVVQRTAPGVVTAGTPGLHGTPVASRAAFADLGRQKAVGGFLTPRARIIDARIIGSDKLTTDNLIQRIQWAVREFAPMAKIFNLSYNAKHPIDGITMSSIGIELDLLTERYGVRFTISAGNHTDDWYYGSLKDLYCDNDTRISEPADAMLGITVGAIVGKTHQGCMSRKNEIAPYSRRGPGFQGFFKPDLVAYGASVFPRGKTIDDEYGTCLNEQGYCISAGTSFTAPAVAGDLAQILTLVPDSIGLAQALLYNGAVPPYRGKKVFTLKNYEPWVLYGRGISSPENSMYSSENKISYICQGTLKRQAKKRVRFHIPDSIAEAEHKRGEARIRVTVTCLAEPPVDKSRGEEYTLAYISAHIHRPNTRGKMVSDNPQDAGNRKKWDTCCHFCHEFSSFSSGDWEVWLELFTRWDPKDAQEVPYSLVITVEDLFQNNNMYSSIIRETGGRYRPLEPVRVKVRQ